MPRIPTGRYPAFSTTLRATTDANGAAAMVFEAERDMLFIGMSVNAGANGAPRTATVSCTYCNTKYIIHCDTDIWKTCCDRKPIFLVGVRENKKLEFLIENADPADDVSITLHGFQGNGCCG